MNADTKSRLIKEGLRRTVSNTETTLNRRTSSNKFSFTRINDPKLKRQTIGAIRTKSSSDDSSIDGIDKASDVESDVHSVNEFNLFSRNKKKNISNPIVDQQNDRCHLCGCILSESIPLFSTRNVSSKSPMSASKSPMSSDPTNKQDAFMKGSPSKNMIVTPARRSSLGDLGGLPPLFRDDSLVGLSLNKLQSVSQFKDDTHASMMQESKLVPFHHKLPPISAAAQVAPLSVSHSSNTDVLPTVVSAQVPNEIAVSPLKETESRMSRSFSSNLCAKCKSHSPNLSNDAFMGKSISVISPTQLTKFEKYMKKQKKITQKVCSSQESVEEKVRIVTEELDEIREDISTLVELVKEMNDKVEVITKITMNSSGSSVFYC